MKANRQNKVFFKRSDDELENGGSNLEAQLEYTDSEQECGEVEETSQNVSEKPGISCYFSKV